MNEYPFVVSGEKPVFLCTWDGDNVEVHTRESLRTIYGETNLFDDDDDGWGYEIGELMTFDQLLEHLRMQPLDKRRTFYSGNMTIQRIR
jgi:hypothetical protein